MQHAEKLGLPILGTYKDEAVSGGDGVEERPGLKDLIAASRANPNAITLVYSVSRLARSQRLLWTLLDDRQDGFGLRLVSCTEPFDVTTASGRAFLGMVAIFSQLEREMASERTALAYEQKKVRGDRVGAKNSLELGGIDVMKQIQGMWKDNGGTLTIRGIVEKLNSDNIPTVTGRGKWQFAVVQKILKTKLPKDGE